MAALSGARRVVALCTAAGLTITACGTNVPHSKVVLANGGGSVVNGTPVANGTNPADPNAPITGGTGPAANPTDGSIPTGGANPTGGGANPTGGGANPTGGGANPTGGGANPTGGGTATNAPNNPNNPNGPAPGTKGSGGVSGDIIPASCPGTGNGTIKLGNVAGYSATGAGPTAQPIRSMIQVWASYVNGHGGICGNKVQMFIRDDGGNASQTAAAYKDLVENQKVVAFVFGNTALTLSAYQNYVEQQKIAVLGGDMLTGSFNRSPVFFPSGASDTEALYGLYKSVQNLPNGTKVAALYCSEVAACADNYKFQTSNKIPETVGSKIVYAKQVSLTQVSFAAECQAAKKAGAGAIFPFGDASFIGRIANSCGQQNIKLGYMIPGTAAANNLASNKYLDGFGITTTQNQPWTADNSPGAKFYQQLTSQYNVEKSGSSMQGFTAVMVTQQILTLLGGKDITAASVMQTARTGVKNFTAGGTIGPQTFRNGPQAQGQCVGGAKIAGGKWTSLYGGSLNCRKGAPGPLPTP